MACTEDMTVESTFKLDGLNLKSILQELSERKLIVK
jgi:hypothetical protein